MSKELLGIKLGENNTIKSTELVEIINHFRQIELKCGMDGKLQKPLVHKNLMAKIRKEIEILENAGLNGGINFKPVEYKDKKGEFRPCFELNRDGMLQMLNSESTLVRYKTIEFINKLEEENKQLKEDLVEVSKVAISDKEQKQREYETKKVMYSWRNLKTVLFDCDYKNIEDTVKDILDFHVNVLKVKDRSYSYGELNKTEYKQVVRKRIDGILKEINLGAINPALRTVIDGLLYENMKQIKSTIKRSTSKVINGLQKEVEANKELSIDDMYCINYHPYSYDNKAIVNGHWSSSYKAWINNFPMDELPSVTELIDSGVDFNKPLKLIVRCINMNKFDTSNLDKAIADVMFNCYRGKYKIDDRVIRARDIETIGFCDEYEDGKIYWSIKNIDNDEITEEYKGDINLLAELMEL